MSGGQDPTWGTPKLHKVCVCVWGGGGGGGGSGDRGEKTARACSRIHHVLGVFIGKND